MKSQDEISFLRPPKFAQDIGIWAGIIAAVLSAIGLIWAAILQITSIFAYLVPLAMVFCGVFEFVLNWAIRPEDLIVDPKKDRINSLRVYANLFAFNSTLLFIPIILFAPLIEDLVKVQRIIVDSLGGKVESRIGPETPVFFYSYCGIVLSVASLIWGVNLIKSLKAQWQLDILKMNPKQGLPHVQKNPSDTDDSSSA